MARKKKSGKKVAQSPHSSNICKSKSGGLVAHLAYVHPLYPTEKQAALFWQWIGVCRIIWNRLLHHSGLYHTFKQTFMNTEDNNSDQDAAPYSVAFFVKIPSNLEILIDF